MSATCDPRSPTIYLRENLDEKRDAVLITFLECDFDVGVDEDNRAILNRKIATKHFTRICIIKTITYPVEAALGFFLLDLNARYKRHCLQRSILKFLTRQSPLEQFMNDVVKYA